MKHYPKPNWSSEKKRAIFNQLLLLKRKKKKTNVLRLGDPNPHTRKRNKKKEEKIKLARREEAETGEQAPEDRKCREEKRE